MFHKSWQSMKIVFSNGFMTTGFITIAFAEFAISQLQSRCCRENESIESIYLYKSRMVDEQKLCCDITACDDGNQSKFGMDRIVPCTSKRLLHNFLYSDYSSFSLSNVYPTLDNTDNKLCQADLVVSMKCLCSTWGMKTLSILCLMNKKHKQLWILRLFIHEYIHNLANRIGQTVSIYFIRFECFKAEFFLRFNDEFTERTGIVADGSADVAWQ